MENESLRFQNECLKAFYPIYVVLLASLPGCLVIKEVGY